MYVIRREDIKGQGKFQVVHDSLEQATTEAERLCKLRSYETPMFVIYKLTAVKKLTASVRVDVEDVSPMSVEEKAKILLATKQAAQQSVGGNMPSFGRIGEAGK